MLISKIKTKSTFKVSLYCTDVKKNSKEGEKKQAEEMDLCQLLYISESIRSAERYCDCVEQLPPSRLSIS